MPLSPAKDPATSTQTNTGTSSSSNSSTTSMMSLPTRSDNDKVDVSAIDETHRVLLTSHRQSTKKGRGKEKRTQPYLRQKQDFIQFCKINGTDGKSYFCGVLVPTDKKEWSFPWVDQAHVLYYCDTILLHGFQYTKGKQYLVYFYLPSTQTKTHPDMTKTCHTNLLREASNCTIESAAMLWINKTHSNLDFFSYHPFNSGRFFLFAAVLKQKIQAHDQNAKVSAVPYSFWRSVT